MLGIILLTCWQFCVKKNCFITHVKIKIQVTKISNSEENSKRKVHKQLAKSKAKTHKTNG